MHRTTLAWAAAGGVSVVCLSIWLGAGPSLQAQSRQARGSKAPSVRQLDLRARKVQADFLNKSAELARAYESAGRLRKAKEVYSRMAKLNPELKGIAEKIKELDEAILEVNPSEIEIEAGAGWGAPVARVLKGKTFRVEAKGTYRMTLTNVSLGPEGFPRVDPPKTGLVPNVPIGALAGVIVVKGKPQKVFPVGEQTEVTPKQDGLLFLRINVPAGAKCTSGLNVRLSGSYGSL